MKCNSIYKVIKASIHGFMVGASFAGIVNTLAPGVIPTFVGYLVGKGFGEIFVRCGLITFGMFASHTVNASVVLLICAVFGGILGGFIEVSKECTKKLRRRKRRRD